jgi:gliding motility-associated-like protein
VNTGSASVTAGGGTPSYTYSWNGGCTTSSCTGLAAGNYTATVTDANGCTQTATAVITSTGGPTATAASNVIITQGQSATLTAGGGGTYLWSNGSTSNPITVSPPVTTIYCVTVIDINNCTDTACVTVTIKPIDCSNAGELYLPNAFSPNGDGENDELKIYGRGLEWMALTIFDRWGNRVFESTDANASWNGHYQGGLLNTGVYVYILKGKCITNGEEFEQHGNVTLTR